MIRTVAVTVFDGVAPFELGVVCEAFGIDRTDQGVPSFDFRVCTVVPGRVRTSMPFELEVPAGLEATTDADLVVVPAMRRGDTPPPELLDALRAVVARGARVMSVCTGAFVLGEAGLLDGRRCTTHWMFADELAERFPRALVDPDVLYVDDGQVITSAGTAAGIDACLHLIREDYGAKVAAAVARRMVVPPHRDGGQAQFIQSPIRPLHCDTLDPVLAWMAGHLDQDLTVETLAARAHMSPRTFARRFRAETGTTPYDWLLARRVEQAQLLLEDGDDSVEQIAVRCGFGTAAVLRHHFTRRLGTTPQAYRRTFRRHPA
ncbi:MAG TPA: helix-turn-helix domain-containing protein [Jiangellales bacterium]|nr:helix-turn-helix domain-containing protein [Jiangellales bacterium]